MWWFVTGESSAKLSIITFLTQPNLVVTTPLKTNVRLLLCHHVVILTLVFVWTLLLFDGGDSHTIGHSVIRHECTDITHHINNRLLPQLIITYMYSRWVCWAAGLLCGI